jgi:hypothetical protein
MVSDQGVIELLDTCIHRRVTQVAYGELIETILEV